MNMKNGTCTKCGSTNLEVPRHFRAQGIGSKTDLNIISCNECGYSELYAMDAEENAPIKKKIAMLWLFAVIIPITLICGVSLYYSFR